MPRGPIETGTSSVTVRGAALKPMFLTDDELARLHWALYLAWGNDWPGWNKLREAMPEETWHRIVQMSGRHDAVDVANEAAPAPTSEQVPSDDSGAASVPFSHAEPPHRVLLCLGPCHGEFYLPLDRGSTNESCPMDSGLDPHPVAVYGLISVHLKGERNTNG